MSDTPITSSRFSAPPVEPTACECSKKFSVDNPEVQDILNIAVRIVELLAKRGLGQEGGQGAAMRASKPGNDTLMQQKVPEKTAQERPLPNTLPVPTGATAATLAAPTTSAVRAPEESVGPAAARLKTAAISSPQAMASVETGKRSSLPAYSLDGPDLPAQKVKAYICDSVDRNWGQIRSSFNFSNDAAGKNEAKAFFMGAASRESGTGETMRTNLITGSDASYSKGPLQTANTAYANNGHPDWHKDSHVPGIEQADLKDSNDLSTAIDMGVRHMCEGAELGKLAGQNSKEAAQLNAMAFHNTGHIEAASKPEWVRDYAGETLKMAAWYSKADRTTDQNVVYTGQLTS